MRKYMVRIGAALSALALAFWLWPREVPVGDLPVVDIDLGEPMIDVMDRSTYDFRFKVIPPISFSVPLAAYESKRDGYYFLRLPNGDRSVQFPWFPAYADIDVTAGQTEGMEIKFFNYPIAVPDNRGDMKSSGGGGLIVPDLTAERQAMIDIYFMLDSLKMQRLETACYPMHPNQTLPCNNPDILPEKEWSAEELGAEFDRFVAEWQVFWDKNDVNAEGKPPYYLMVARWISDRGAIVSMHVEPGRELVSGIPLSEVKRTYVTQITINNFYALRRGIHVKSCFGDIEGSGVLGGDIRYTLEQARVIYGEMLEKMGPLRDDSGEPITDPVSLNGIITGKDHRTEGRLIRNSWGEVPIRVDRGEPYVNSTPEWCAMVKDLEQKVGYAGP